MYMLAAMSFFLFSGKYEGHPPFSCMSMVELKTSPFSVWRLLIPHPETSKPTHS